MLHEVDRVDLADDVINKMTHENAMRIFQFDPFAHRAKEQCTVGALRAEAGDVDVVTRSPRQKRSDTDISRSSTPRRGCCRTTDVHHHDSLRHGVRRAKLAAQ